MTVLNWAPGMVMAAAAICASVACAQGAKVMIPTEVNGKLVQAATTTGWKPEDVDIIGNEQLNQNKCQFFQAVHKRVMDGPTLELAVLPDGRVVGGDPAKVDARAAASILMQCGDSSPADWWAEVVARFSGKVRGKVVKSTKNAFAVGEIEKRGATFSSPSLERTGSSVQLRFFTIQHEPTQPYKVSATLSNSGELTVTNEPLGR